MKDIAIQYNLENERNVISQKYRAILDLKKCLGVLKN